VEHARPDDLVKFLVASVGGARVVDAPFPHLEFDRVFPDDVYGAIVARMPDRSYYRAMHGRSRRNDLADGTHTRTKIDLFPEYLRHLRPEDRGLWDRVGTALRAAPVRRALMQRLAPGLVRRFGPGFERVGMYPIPVLTRDIAGYHIAPHTDTRWKGITVQLYLPPDDSVAHIGTVFHERLADGTLVKRSQMPFAPNTGYAFAVGDDTWHSVETVGPEVKTRDSILLTYFVDAGALRFLRNRGKRIGNFLLNEVRSRQD
jgi:hypothetical protein